MGILRKLLHSKCDRELAYEKDVSASWRCAHGSVVEHYSRIVDELRGERYKLNKERDELRQALIKQDDISARLLKERDELQGALESALRREAELVCRVADLRSSAAALRTAVPFTESEIRDGLRLLVSHTDIAHKRTLRQVGDVWIAFDDAGTACMKWARKPSARDLNAVYIRPPKEA